VQSDLDLHDEQGGPFFPVVHDPEDITITAFDLNFDYALQAEFGGEQSEFMDFSKFLQL
jgi:hypothetical protein